MSLERNGVDPDKLRKLASTHLKRLDCMYERKNLDAYIIKCKDITSKLFERTKIKTYKIGEWPLTSDDAFETTKKELKKFLEGLALICSKKNNSRINNNYITGDKVFFIADNMEDEFTAIKGVVYNLEINFNREITKQGRQCYNITVKEAGNVHKKSKENIKAAMRIYLNEYGQPEEFRVVKDAELLSILFLNNNSIDLPFDKLGNEYGLIPSTLGIPRSLDRWKKLFNQYGKITIEVKKKVEDKDINFEKLKKAVTR